MVFTLKPVAGRDFVDREELVSDMVSALSSAKSSVGFALYGRRRVGKTSVFREVSRKLEGKRNVVCVYFSLWDLAENTVAEFAKSFSAAVLDAYRDRLSLGYRTAVLVKASAVLLREILGKTRLEVKLRNEIEFLLTFDKAKEASVGELLERAFNLPEQLARETNTKCVLFLDEFPSVMDLKNGSALGESAIKKIRTIHERQKNTVLCISGSVRKTMSVAALSPASAFYGQLVLKEVKPLEKKHVARLLEKNFGREVEAEVVDKVFEFSGGVPFYVQFVGRELRRLAPKKIDAAAVGAAVNDFFEEEGNVIFKEEFQSLSEKEKAVLAAAAGTPVFSPSEISAKSGLASNVVAVFFNYLVEKGFLEKVGRGEYAFADPVFAEWITRTR